MNKLLPVWVAFLVCCGCTVFGQSRWDNNWILTNWMLFNFDSNEVSSDIITHEIGGVTTGLFHNAISSSEGRLLFHTSGCFILDKNGYIIESGDSLSPKMMDLGYCLHGSNIWRQHPLILPIEDSVVSFILLNLDASILDWPIDSMFSGIRPLDLYFASINYDPIFKEIRVSERDIVAVHDTLSTGYLTACKHANGRDWWVMVPHWNSNCYYSILIGPTGIMSDTLICSGSVFGDTDFGGQMTISPDGKWAARSKPWVEGEFGNVDLFTFDRCNGALEFVQSLSFQQDFPSYTGVSISPNSQYLYVTHYKSLWQYDLLSPDIQGSIFEAGKIEYELSFERSSLYYQQVAPDGKIYIASPLGHYYLSTIEFPNNKEEAAGFIPHSVHMPENRQNYGGLPNYPNYRLGPLDGSSCDTLGLDNHPIAKYRYTVSESDALSVRFTNLSYFDPDSYFWDFDDGQYSEELDPKHAFEDGGIYHVCLTVENSFGSDTFCQTINLLETSEENFFSHRVDYYPNPASDYLYIRIDPRFSGPATFRIFSQDGLTVMNRELNETETRVDVSGLAPGMYFLQISNGGEVWVSKLVILK